MSGKKVCMYLNPDMLNKFDQARGMIPRSTAVRKIVEYLCAVDSNWIQSTLGIRYENKT